MTVWPSLHMMDHDTARDGGMNFFFILHFFFSFFFFLIFWLLTPVAPA